MSNDYKFLTNSPALFHNQIFLQIPKAKVSKGGDFKVILNKFRTNEIVDHTQVISNTIFKKHLLTYLDHKYRSQSH